MKSRETLIRLKKFQVDEKRRRVAQIEGMIADFQRMSVDLEREIQHEQDRAGIQDPSHFAYPTYAKAANQRRRISPDPQTNCGCSLRMPRPFWARRSRNSRRSNCSTNAIRRGNVPKKAPGSRPISTASA